MNQAGSSRSWDGVLLLDKPSGVTSHDCVAAIRNLFSIKQVGHLGTLDPRAKGLLPLCMGSATKLSSLMVAREKEYAFFIRLGMATSTQDMDGEITAEKPVPEFSENTLKEISEFYVKGPYQQQTPDYSARKVQGRKLYQIARSGGQVPQLPPRLVVLKSMKLSQVNEDTLYGVVSCTAGTYVRQLAVDIAEKLGTVGVLFDLTRTRVGDWSLDSAIKLDALKCHEAEGEDLRQTPAFIPVERVVGHFPQLLLNPGLWEKIRHGVQPIRVSRLELQPRPQACQPGDLICGMLPSDRQAPHLGVLLSVAAVQEPYLSCKLQKLLAH
jgi:tRNA pseudouridine55 synthase